MGRNSRPCSKFFFKPYIDINPKKLQRIKKSITLTLDKNKIAVFNLNIWTLDIENKEHRKLSRNANSSYFDIDIIKDKRTMNKDENVLLWLENDFVFPSEMNETTRYKEINKSEYHGILLDGLYSTKEDCE